MRLPVVLSGVIRGVLAAILLFAAPLVGIRRTYDFHAYTWPELSLLAAAVATGVVCGYLFSLTGAKDSAGPRTTSLKANVTDFFERHGFNIVGCLYVALYTSCAALSVRLGICLTPMHGAAVDPFAVFGLLVFLGGALSMIRAFSFSARIAAMERAFQATHPHGAAEQETVESGEAALPEHSGAAFVINGQLLAHPVLFAWLLILTGVPLAIGSWLPMAGLPGTFVAMKWKTQTTPPVVPSDASERKVWKLLPYVF